MHITDHGPQTADHHTFLRASEVFTRYRVGRSKGYQLLKSPGFPPRMGLGYRLDLLMAWEEGLLPRAAEPAAPATSQDASSSADDAARFNDDLFRRERTRGGNARRDTDGGDN